MAGNDIDNTETIVKDKKITNITTSNASPTISKMMPSFIKKRLNGDHLGNR